MAETLGSLVTWKIEFCPKQRGRAFHEYGKTANRGKLAANGPVQQGRDGMGKEQEDSRTEPDHRSPGRGTPVLSVVTSAH